MKKIHFYLKLVFDQLKSYGKKKIDKLGKNLFWVY